MPSSRKRTKGKERKARQALPGASYFTRALDRDTSCSLRHGAVAFSEDVCQVMITFREELNRQLLEGINTSETLAKEVGFSAFHSALVVHPKMWLEEANRDVIFSTFVAQGVSCILKDSESSRLMAEQYAAGILTLEIKSQSDVNSSRAFRDNCQGGDRALIAFYRKRTPCCCLDARWRKLKAMPAVGLCDGCKEIFPRCTLKLCCGCLCEQYCSAACQERAWRAGHKSQCTVIAEWIQDQKSLTDI